MSVTQLAAILYRSLRSNAVSVAALRTELDALSLAIATNPAYGREITSATIDGQSYGAQVTMTNAQRLALLDKVLTHIDAGVPPSTRSFANF